MTRHIKPSRGAMRVYYYSLLAVFILFLYTLASCTSGDKTEPRFKYNFKEMEIDSVVINVRPIYTFDSTYSPFWKRMRINDPNDNDTVVMIDSQLYILRKFKD